MATAASDTADRFRPPAPNAASIDELDAAIRRAASRVNTATCELLVLVREFDDRFGWAKWSFPNGSEWLAWRSGISVSAAREQLRTAHALRRLPRISRAFAEGRLSYTKVRALTRVAEPYNEARLLAWAIDATAPQIEERCRQMRNVHPDSAAEARSAWARRTLSVWRNTSRGTMTLSGELPVEAGEILLKALERAVELGEAAAGPEFEETGWQAQQADALIAIAQAYLAGGEQGKPAAPDHYQVVVHVDADAFGGATRAEVAADAPDGEQQVEGRCASDDPGAGPIATANADTLPDIGTSPDTATPLRGGVRSGRATRADLPIDVIRRLSCDGSIVAVTEDRAGNPLNVGRRQRLVPPALRRALWSRDRGCAFPGCGRTRWVHAHHLRHWADGGDTSLENTLLLCSHHHRLVHEGGFRIRRDADGDVHFERSDGRVIPRCGYRSDDMCPDPALLDDRSAEAWLAAIVRRRKPPDEVREERAVYTHCDVAQHRGPLTHAAAPRRPWPVPPAASARQPRSTQCRA
jgi:hypothetical protein